MRLYQWDKVYQLGEDELHRPPPLVTLKLQLDTLRMVCVVVTLSFNARMDLADFGV